MSPKGPCVKDLVPMAVLLGGAMELQGLVLFGKELHQWGHAPEQDHVTWAPSSSLSLPDHEVRGLFHHTYSLLPSSTYQRPKAVGLPSAIMTY
jgi:hypothetical protein